MDCSLTILFVPLRPRRPSAVDSSPLIKITAEDAEDAEVVVCRQHTDHTSTEGRGFYAIDHNLCMMRLTFVNRRILQRH